MAGMAKPVEKRCGRGAGREETPATFLIDGYRGGTDAALRDVAAMDGVSEVAADVTHELFSSRLYAPHGRWELLIKLKGQRWLIFTRSGMVVAGWEQEAIRLSEQLARLVIAAEDHGPGAGVRFLLADRGETLIQFLSHGEDFSLKDVVLNSTLVRKDYDAEQARLWATRFQSDRHHEDWWRGRPTTKSMDLLLRELQAYLPILVAERDGGVVTLNADERVLEAVERVDLVTFGARGSVKARPSEIDRRLTDAISNGDPAAVAAALAAGADPRHPPGVNADGLELALTCLRFGKALLIPDKLAIVELLLSAGAGQSVPADARAREKWWRKRKREELAAIYRDYWIINGDEPELDLPASMVGEKPPVTVEPRKFKQWCHAGRRDSTMAALEARGFDRVGEFAILESPALRMLVLFHEKMAAFAVINEYTVINLWTDVVRWHRDGTSLCASNLDVDPRAIQPTPHHQKLLQPRWGVNRLVDFIQNEPPPPAGVLAIGVEGFKVLFEQYYAEDRQRERK